MQSSPFLFVNIFPTLLAIVILSIAVFLFGGTSILASFLVSFISLGGAAFLAWRYVDMRPDRLVVYMLVLWGFFISLHFVRGQSLGNLHHYLIVLSCIALFWMGDFAVERCQKPSRVWTFVLLLGLSFAAFAFFQHLLSPNHILGMERPSYGGHLTGTFVSSSTAALFLGMMILASVAHIHRTWRVTMAKSKTVHSITVTTAVQASALSIATLLFSTTALLLTASRLGILLTLCACILFGMWIIWIGRSNRNKFGTTLNPKLIYSIGFGAILLMIWSLINDSSGMPVDQVSRSELTTASVRAFLYEPLFGHGLGSFNEAKLLGTDTIINTNVVGHSNAYNFYLETLVQSGVIGLLAIGFVYIIIVGTLMKSLIGNQPYKTYLLTILLMSAFVVVQGFFGNGLNIPAIVLFHGWILGVGYGLHKKYLNTSA